MKILLFTENFYAGGMDVFIINLINNWPANDEFFLVCNHDHPGLDVIEKRLKRPCKILRHNTITLPYLVKKFSHSFVLNLLRKALVFYGQYLIFCCHVLYFYKYFNKLKPDRIFIVNGGYPAGNTCRAAALSGLFKPAWRKPIFIYHNDPIKARLLHVIPEYIIDFLVEKSISCLVTVSHYTQNQIINRPGISFSKKQRVIYNGIELHNTTKTDSIRKELHIKENAPLLLMLGTYEPRKGHDFLLRSFCIVRKSLPETHLVIAGYGYPYERSYVESLVTKYELSQHTHLLEFRNDVSSLLKETDVLVVPSQKNESFGLIIVEAMSQQIPVVATKIGGIPEVLEDGEGGYTTPLNTEEFANKIIDLLNDKALRKRVGNAGMQVFLSKFQARRMAADYFELLTHQ